MATRHAPAPNGTPARAEAAIASRSYRYIRAWGAWMGSYPYFVRETILQAARENAPQNAIYRNQDGTWRTMDDLPDTALLLHLEKLAERWA